MSIDGGISQPMIGESCDPSANHLVRFSDQNPSTTATKKLVLKNMRYALRFAGVSTTLSYFLKFLIKCSCSNVPLRFNWKIMKPCMRARDIENDKNRMQSHAMDEKSVFAITPNSGEFQPDASFQFDVTSLPSEVQYVKPSLSKSLSRSLSIGLCLHAWFYCMFVDLSTFKKSKNFFVVKGW